MKQILTSALLLSTIIFTFFSCQEQDIVQTTSEIEVPKIEIMDFRGEKVLISANFPKELFNQSQEDFDVYYATLKENSRTRQTAQDFNWTYEELNSFLAPYVVKYPKLSWEAEISQSDLKRIYKDFPGISTVEQVREKAGIIFDYYETLCKNEVVPAAIAYENARTPNNGRTTGGSFGALTTPEKNVLLNHPLKAPCYIAAVGDAVNLTNSFYGPYEQQDGKAGNAFQHSTWNALTIRFVLKETPASEDDAITFTREGTSAHEKNDAGEQQTTDNSAMDLHNNMSARQWMRNETKWGFGPFRSMPGVSDITTKMQERANSCAMQLKNEILVWHGSIATQAELKLTWNRLYNDNTSSNEHLVKVVN